MPNYRYRARDASGQAFDGVVEANTYDAAVEQILNQGATPLTVEAGDEQRGLADRDLTELLRRYLEPKVTLDDLVMFTRQLETLLRAGVSIIRTLRGLSENAKNPRLARALDQSATGLERGEGLSEAMGHHPNVFPRLLIAMVEVGEETGQLEAALGRVAGNLDQERQTRQTIRQALRYPSFVMVAITIGIAVINIFVIPAFADIFEQLGADLPIFTVILINTSDFFVAYWPYMLGALAAALLGVRAYVRSEAGRLRWDRLKLRLPIVGKILLQALLARFARTFSMAMRSGVPPLQSLRSVSGATDNAYIARGIEEMRNGIEQGQSLYQVAEESGLFTPLVLQMLAVGEETGQVAEMMDQVAGFYEGEVEASLDQLSSSIEPILIGVIGALVLVLALGVFLPMWQMGQAAL